MILLSDLRASSRSLLRHPFFTMAVVLVLALGIGGSTAVFSIINVVLLRPLSYPDSDRLVLLSERSATYPSFSVAMPNYLDWRDAQQGFTDLAIFSRNNFNLSFPRDRRAVPERINGATVSASFLGVLGLHPALGRDFTVQDDTPGGPKVALIGDALWRRRFAADPNVLGQSILVDGTLSEIVGVLPPGVKFPRLAEVFVPFGDIRRQPSTLKRSAHDGLRVLGRLKSSFTLAGATGDLERIAEVLATRYPDSNKGHSVKTERLLDASVGEYRQSLYLLLVAVLCVLLIACANVANLQLARANARRKELAVRAALGASRARLVRQLLTESFLLAAAGGGLGTLLASWGLDAIVALGPANVPRFQEAGLDWRAVLFAIATALGSGLLVGAWPAWRVSRNAALGSALHESNTRSGAGTAAQGRTRSCLVVAQLALALVLLAGAGLTIKSFWRLMNAPLGFEDKGLLVMSLALPDSRYPGEKAVAFYDGLLERLRALPGVEAAATGVNIPFTGNDWSQGGNDWESGLHVTGQPPDPPKESPSAEVNFVTPGYFKTMKMPILHGHDFGPTDDRAEASTVVIDEWLARRFFPGQDPIGQHLDPFRDGQPPMEIVGVVPHTRNRAPGVLSFLADDPQIYAGAARMDLGERFLLVRPVSGDPLALTEPVRQTVLAMDPDVPVAEIATMEQNLWTAMASQRLVLVLLGTFAALALVLASLGLYGVMALGVSQRTRELGIRMALGAQRPAVLRLILGQSARLIGLGLALGLVVALGAGRWLASVVYGATAVDVGVLLSVSLLLGTIGLLASYLPARRATRIDPLVALREE